ncbi:MAG TPA: 16S rRNA (uracil(1498)-N(3))-methyltransferase [Caulobacteraceae bacterium]|nr:16S rRNA (uracil(1498)-N(3))-methyltransferase [Caulobacteraceae bacterium]
MIRLLVESPLAAGAGVIPSPDQARYLTSVMRKAVGDELLVFNGRDGEWRAVIAEVSKRGCRLELAQQVRPQEAGPDLDLVVALVKRPRLEAIVEKAAELGARRVRLVVTQHTNADRARLPRLAAIATEAAEQTGRLDVPQIVEAEKLGKLLDGWDTSRRLMFCDEGGEARPAIEALAGEGPWAILIGPEGGFSAEERERLRSLPFVTPVSLGPRILRADTAAISAMTLWQAALGDWRG